MPKKQVKDVFAIQEVSDKKYWRQIGVGFVNGDNSINLKLNMFPELQLQLRDRKEKE